MREFEAGLDGVVFESNGCRLLGAFYRGGGDGLRPTAVLLHGLPGIEKHLDVAYRLRDLGWNCLTFHFRGSWGSGGAYSIAGLVDDTRAAVEWVLRQPSVDPHRLALIDHGSPLRRQRLASARARRSLPVHRASCL
jgi:alpha/beta superfamily hydrolase